MAKRSTFKFLFLAALTAFWISSAPPGFYTGVAKLQAAPVPENGVIVYQFHRRFRCEACYKLEASINEAIKNHFPEELEAGRLVFSVLDLDGEGSGQYEKKYNFFYNTVIVVDIENGKETRFKNLEEVWSLVEDKEAAVEYIRSEIAEYL
ncbi:MAG: nitrophenyl compound nitroreductase subunit ArsF family protein [bacterium]|nr:nitrophenyl compound nitroreductase subunit ArsF family protein [bacterium]MDT8365499.1 nitrophenyl compound nitroreductase subunit ArsF family protein [bacterium]